ncbi:MAG: quinolinate synthase NadA, partial [Candidatus Heimdallarchaeaceae archaeon]
MVVTDTYLPIRDFDKEEIEKEAARLYEKLKHLGFSKEYCANIAPITLEINRLKKEKNISILAHSYQTADIIAGVADFVGDSLGLAKKATTIPQQTILFSGVDFMAETVKILNPEKTILVPGKRRGCTLADSITAEDVRKLKEAHPGAPVVCYVNTTAEVKAESDICCTSANVLKIIETLDADTIIFIPDFNMGQNLARLTGKNIITWKGFCKTHHIATVKKFQRQLLDPIIVSFAHLECRPEIIERVEFYGGTGDMTRYLNDPIPDRKILFLTEQGFIDRMKMEHPELSFEDSGLICVNMKINTLENILLALSHPTEENI